MKKIFFWTLMVLISLFLINCGGDEVADVETSETEETLMEQVAETEETLMEQTSETEETLMEQTDTTLQASKTEPVPDSTVTNPTPVAPSTDTNVYDKIVVCTKENGKSITYKILAETASSLNICKVDLNNWSEDNEHFICSGKIDTIIIQRENEGYICNTF